MRHLLSIGDLTDSDLSEIIVRGCRLAARRDPVDRPLADRIIGILFRQTSTRTRTAFSSGALRLGAQIVTFQPADLQTNTGETLQDTSRVLSRMLDALVVRTATDPDELPILAAQRDMPVINAMSPGEHPTQAIADLTTMLHHFGRIEGLRVIYIGEGNNTAVALARALCRFQGVHLELRTPPGHGLPPEVSDMAVARGAARGAVVVERHDMRDLPADTDVIYTTRWQTTGTVKSDADWRDVFAPFQVDASLWQDSPKAVLMHDLPAHRGDEITGEILDGPNSIAFTQAGFKLWSAMAVLEWCCGRGQVAQAGTE